MPTINGDRIPFGLDDLVPTTAHTAWGARLIVNQDGLVDFLHDRHGFAGEHRKNMIKVLTSEFPVPRMTQTIGDYLKSGQMKTREEKDFTIFANRLLEVHANTNGSGGYCYVTAWLTP